MYSNVPSRLPEPPPVAVKDFLLDLMDGDRVVGSIRPDAIAFLGFGNEVEAAHAAAMAHRFLARRIAQREGRRPMPIDAEPLRLVGESGERDIVASVGRVARLIEPAHAAPAGESYGFELALPAPMDELSVRAKAHMIYRGLRRSGIRWSMWAPRPAPSRPVVVPKPVVSAERDMIVADPLPVGQLAVSVLLLALAVLAVIVPASIAGILAFAGLVGLMAMRLSVALRFVPAR